MGGPVSSTRVDLGGNLYFNQDCITGAREHLGDESVDLIITDPPYGIQGHIMHRHYNRDERFVADGYVEVDAGQYNEFSHRWISEAYRVLKPGGCIYVVSGYTNLYHILDALRTAGFSEVNHIIWRYRFGVFTKKKYISSHYHILFYEKPGKRRHTFNVTSRFGLGEKDPYGGSLNYQDREDVWDMNREYKRKRTKNKNELPLELLVKMIQYSSDPGDTVCDMFMGGFSTAKAAIGLDRRFVGFEISKQIFSTRLKDVEGLKPGYLQDGLRTPMCVQIRNQGKSWTEAELSHMRERFLQLKANRVKKYKIIPALCEEFGRGRWAIEKALKKNGLGMREPK